MSELGISIPFGALLLALCGWVFLLSRALGKVEGMCDNLGCVPELQLAVAKLTWRQEQADAHAVDILHRDDNRERDLLMAGLLASTLTKTEIERVTEMLRQAAHKESTPEGKMAAYQLLGRAEWEMHKAEKRGA